jgi:hypothetical protein
MILITPGTQFNIFISYNRGHQASMLILLLGDATVWHHYQFTLALMMEAA